MYHRLFAISYPLSASPIIAILGFSRFAESFTFQLCWVPYPKFELTFESLLITTHILIFAKSLGVTWEIFKVIKNIFSSKFYHFAFV